jgi:D-sedoheptulose 7-phosphate isomerase
MHENIEQYWKTLTTMTEVMPLTTLVRAAELLLDCHRRRANVFILGNGGSASTASHMACDLAKGTRVEGIAPFRVIPLTDNSALLTAWGNDASYERVFAEQLANLVEAGDVLIAISTSGNSPNVVAAAEVARQQGATTIALTGQHGGKLARLADLTIRVPSGPIEQVEDMHLAVTHSLCVALRSRLAAQVAQPMPHKARLVTEIILSPTPTPIEAVS